MLLSITIMHTSDIYYKVNYDKLHQSGLCRLGLILLTPIMITSRNITYMSPEYCLYSLESSTTLILSVWSLTGRFLVVFYIDIAYFFINMNNISLVHWSHVSLHQDRSTQLTLQPTLSPTVHPVNQSEGRTDIAWFCGLSASPHVHQPMGGHHIHNTMDGQSRHNSVRLSFTPYTPNVTHILFVSGLFSEYLYIYMRYMQYIVCLQDRSFTVILKIEGSN